MELTKGVCVMVLLFSTVLFQPLSYALPRSLPTIQSSRGVYLSAARPDGSVVFFQEAKLRVRRNGQLTVRGGYAFLSGIYIPQDTTRVRVTSRGIVWATIPGTVSTGRPNRAGRWQVGQLSANTFERPESLASIDSGYLVQTEESGPPTVGNFREPGFGFLKTTSRVRR
jgi:flagellar basal-body rod protein FlgG